MVAGPPRRDCSTLLAAAERLLAVTGDAVALCPHLRRGGRPGDRPRERHVATPVDAPAERGAGWGGARSCWPGRRVAYNVVEAVVAVAAGLVAGSVALVGFGLDSVVEVSSGLIILWQFRHRLPETRERQALRLMAFSFFALAAYVTVESVRALFAGGEPRALAGRHRRWRSRRWS